MAEPKPYEGVTGYPVTAAPTEEIVFTEEELIEGRVFSQPPLVTVEQPAPPETKVQSERGTPTDAAQKAYGGVIAMPFAQGLTGYPRVDSLPAIGREHPIVQAIVDSLSADAAFRMYVDDPYYRKWGNGAGAIRDLEIMAAGVDQHKSEKDGGAAEYICTGIAERAQDLMEKARASGKLPEVRGIGQIEREFAPTKGHFMDHTANTVTLRDGRKFVLDWHRTLDVTNPMVSTVEQFTGEEEQP